MLFAIKIQDTLTNSGVTRHFIGLEILSNHDGFT